MANPRVATTSLCGCFGCHMSLLDIDERILELVELVDFDRSPINDIKELTGSGRASFDFLGNVAIGGAPTESSADQSSFRIGASVRF